MCWDSPLIMIGQELCIHVFLQEDFRPILRELLLTHRGLEFLHDTPEFQDRYGMSFLKELLILNLFMVLIQGLP